MLGTIPAVRRKLIERIATASRRLSRPGDPVEGAGFIRRYYRGVAEEDLAEYESRDLAAGALAHLRFGAVRPRNQPLVRVYNADARHDGWASTHTIVEVVAQDMPFLVDSLVMVLTQASLTVHLMVHPVLAARRDDRGRLREIAEQDDAGGSGFARESWQHMQVDRISDETRLEELRSKLIAVLEDVHLAVSDWRRMRQRALEVAADIEKHSSPLPANEVQEIAELLRWMEDNHFTFLGYREYRLRRGRSEDWLDPLPDTGLGILRSRRGARHESTRLTGDLRELARAPELLTVTKANSISTVHRATYLDYIGLRTFDGAGHVTGERRFLGLFTSAAYNRSPREIPLLREKIQRVIAHFGLDPTSHDGKAVEHVLETYPRDELFQARISDLIRIVRGVVNLYERQRVRVFLRRDAFGRFYSGLIYVPRDRYNTQVRERMEGVIRERLGASSVDSQVQLSESALARIHMIVRVPQERGGPRVDVEALEKRIAETVHTWSDRLREALIVAYDESQGIRLAERYQAAFPAAYEEDVDAPRAVEDIKQLEEILENSDRIAMRLVKGDNGRTHLRLFRSAAAIPLSQALPVLENMGFLVVSERPYRIAVKGSRPIWLQDFEMQSRGAAAVDPTELDPRFTEAFIAVWNGRAENDGFNRLLVSTPLTWREAMVLRAYCRFLLQTGSTFSQAYMEQVLISNAPVAAALFDIFKTQFDPALGASRESALAQLQRKLTRLFDAVTSLDEDRILRRFSSVIGATLRTNYFQNDSEGRPKSYLSFKLDSRQILDLPPPKPVFEIFVYSPRVEGVHLRMGHVARGGIRWSDRREDFRTEVLGLLKAQNVKNTLIVPVGAKGGFVPKRLPLNASRDDVQREAVECYRTFIRGLLDLTDNIVDARIVPPAQVVRRDGDDAYLVVAADKGTATFSDIANRIAAEYRFWLGDAFASGGSSGYDHKKMGITARGAWECVKRHFREIGIDSQAQVFTAIGIGDMSGDVFGNGMLLSRHIKLLAAFNHQHIFLDPSPDPQVSFEERQRLFALPRSTWEDYDAKLISRGGGVFARSSKTIRLSSQVQAMLGVKRDAMTPPELIRTILCMPVDLLWNGGIGTYVKASAETHLDIGDRANDALRVNGNELRCKVVGEGGNLGLSQRGRIEYALSGGRLNTDFIDNSGGVDCSDHEVNIKILLNSATRRARLTPTERDRLLAEMTEEVAGLVLRDNYLQSQALSVVESRAAKDLLEHAHTIRSLELSGHLDRSLEFLPSAEEIDARHKAGLGLTRPELAILLAYAKMALYSRLIDSDVPEDPYLGHELERYFPAVLQRRSKNYLHQHRLRREIIATATTNSMINRMGATFARRTQDDTGANAATVVRAFAISREAFRMRSTWSAIEALDNKVDAASQYEMMFETTRLLRFSTYWLIRRDAAKLDIERQVSRLQAGFSELDDALPRVLSGADLASFESLRDHYRAAKVPEALVKRMASLPALRSAPDVVEIASQSKLPIATAAAVYFGVGTALSLDWLRQQIESLAVEGHWQAVARTTLRDNIYILQRTLCLQVIGVGRRLSPERALETWLTRRREAVEQMRQSIADMKALPVMDFATLSVALQAVRRLAE